ncbi:hypothetical protein [Streptomyces sp. NPDC059411]|uniref:hypothetical protein n=1 Tax=Streptomyces sp. NPDC059411 TaxID=3346825 RepID=UPI0036BF4E38
MSIPWRSSAAALQEILGRHGVTPGGACAMEAAWAAFEEFVQVPVEGIEATDDDGDGFIVEWGVWDWNAGRPAVSLGRLLAVNDDGDGDGDRSDPYWQPQYWKVEFQACFAEDPAWAGLHVSGAGDSGFDHAAIGGPRADALSATLRLIEQDPLLSAMWRSTPTHTEVTLDRAG